VSILDRQGNGAVSSPIQRLATSNAKSLFVVSACSTVRRHPDDLEQAAA